MGDKGKGSLGGRASERPPNDCPEEQEIGETTAVEGKTGEAAAVEPEAEATAVEPEAASGGVDAAAVLAFLETAPPDVRAWLAKQVSGPDADAKPVDTGKPDPEADASEVSVSNTKLAAAKAPAIAEEDDDYDAELLDDEDDDILKRVKRQQIGAGGAGKSGSGPSTKTGRVFIALALVAGICFGVWYAGRPDANVAEQPTTQQTMSGGVSDAEADARIAELTAALKEDPNNADNHLELGVLLFNKEQLDAALEHWTKVTELAPDQAEAWYNLGFYHLSSKPADYAAAKAAWEKVIEIDPESAMAKTVSTHIEGLANDMAADPPAEGDAPAAPKDPGEG